jgi:hypothetical protein
MGREDIPWIAILVVLVLVGFLVGQRFVASSAGEAATAAEAEVAFRSRFWEERSLDLGVQVGLVFVGALGIAALLPQGREEAE